MSTTTSSPATEPRSTARRPAAAPAPQLARASRASRVASLLYGSLAYVLFLGTFLYAIGFVTGLGVPKTVDGGARVPLGEALLVNGGLLALFAVQHTIMARRAFKRRWTRIVPQVIERATFVLVTCAILIATFWQWRHLPGTLWEVQGPLAWFLNGASFLGWGIVLFASFLIDHFELFGLRQVVRHFLGRPAEAPRFRERSLYRMVRHPLMLGFLLAFWATPVMSMGHLFFAAMCTGYILVGIQIEERSLVAEHGESYLDYRRRVPMLLPLPGRRSA
ncbi:MAG TPA: isoprenylcysteine carboxylmethyltransferase family protein [Planctomycetota bacterium]|nr:isoprenylcysteine carboxylmethyltransferase family protein [Planctomycetota bacterium]